LSILKFPLSFQDIYSYPGHFVRKGVFMKKNGIGKRVVLVVILLALCMFQAAAQDNSFGLDDKVGIILQMLSSP
jgi:hypothetical protein